MKEKMVITDFDGTLLNSDSKISKNDIEYLKKLGDKDIFRVIATGRSIFSLRKIIKPNFPIDYVIFSSGAGIFDWEKQEIIATNHLSDKEVKTISSTFYDFEIDFCIHKKIPENHKFEYYIFEPAAPDIIRRTNLYEKHSQKIENMEEYSFKSSSQVLGITDPSVKIYNSINETLSELNVIRTTSPLDQQSMWLEVFPKNVSKSEACKKLCRKLNVEAAQTVGIGNDYNDIDLLEWAGQSFVVENAPTELKEKFSVTGSNDDQGFSKVVNKFFKKESCYYNSIGER